MRKLGNEAVIVAESLELINFDKLVSLNASAAYVWEALPTSDFDVATVVSLLINRYDVDEDTARKDARELIDVWKEAGILEDKS